MQVSDIAATAAVAKKHGATFVVDNTFLSPYFQVLIMYQLGLREVESSSSQINTRSEMQPGDLQGVLLVRV